MRMKAAVFEGPDAALTFDDIEIESPRRHEIRVRLAAAGVCHSDYRVVAGDWSAKAPLVLGHEGSGIVESVGEGVDDLEVGDTVILSWTPSCGTCRYCVIGRPQLCEQAVTNAYDNVLPDGTTRLRRGSEDVYSYLSVGSFAEYAVVPRSGAVKVHADIDPAVGALVGCAITTGVGATINTRPVAAGENVLVFGAGGVGLSTVMGAHMQAPARLIAVDVADDKLALARELGATDTINAAGCDVESAVRDLTCGNGVDVAYEAVGMATTVEQAIECLASGGTAVVVGQVASGERVSINPMRMSGRELTLTGSNYGSARPAVDFQRILELHARGVLPLDRLVGERIRLDQLNAAFQALGEGRVSGRTVVEF